MATTPEGAVKRQIKRWLAERGAVFFMPVSNGMGMMGVPDFLCCWRGRFLAVEAKAPGKRGNTTVLQQRNLERIAAAGGIAVVVDSIDQLHALEHTLPAPA